uniref:FAR1 domain-containing protein n=1 Tax=Fagus sylvatica TaxID=28930 RepID=A0A2N9EQI8_FAGSY
MEGNSSVYVAVDPELHTNIHDENLENSSDMELRLSNDVATVISSHLVQTVEMSQNSSRAESTAVEQDEPYVGQEFESEAAAHAFYNAYGMRMGFKTRVSNLSRSRLDRSIIARTLVCNKEGHRVPDKRDTKIVRSRSPTRVGCKAMLSIKKLSTGKWVVTKYVKEHSHVLVPSKGRKRSMYNQFPRSNSSSRSLILAENLMKVDLAENLMKGQLLKGEYPFVRQLK